MNRNFLKTYAGVVFVMSAIMTLILVVAAVIDKSTSTSGYMCGGKKEMYEEKKSSIPEDRKRRIEERRKKMRERQKKMYV